MARYLRQRAEQLGSDADVLGPAPCFIHKVRGRYRWQVLVRAGSVAPLLEGFNPGPGWTLDVDPLSVL